ncbi:MAG TPA: ATP-binding cassette domain-containing protein [Acidimicrobiales bacterium]|nr:ATP-binding cassette domain-containing protein [Acidimicrobiales bacterium]
MPYTLDVEGLRKSYGDHLVLEDLDLQVGPGEIFALLGPNGAGKTTAVRILSTLIRPDSGTAVVAGHEIGSAPAAVRAAISLTGQYAAVDEVLTGWENLVMIGQLRRLATRRARHRATELLDQFDLVDAADRRVSTYSGGMRRRLDLAMSLVVRPTVLFLDEPTTGLDPRSRRDMWSAVGTLASSGVTVLLTTQYLEEADVLADRIAVLDRGRKVAEGTAAELKAQVGSETVELFFDDAAAPATAARVLESVGRLVLADTDTGASDLVVRVAGDGSAEDVRRLLDLLAAEQVPAARLSLHRPSLDEVFLTLTAHPADAPAPADDRPLERTF